MNDPQEPATAPEPTHGLPQSLTEAVLWLRSDKVSCYELTRGYLARIEAAEPNLNAFITVMADQALAAARARDEHRAAGKALGSLHGVPLVAKDIYDTAGVRTTVGAKIFEDRIPDESAAVIRRLEAAGAVFLGKTNMNEFAAGVTGTNARFGDTANPLMPGRSPGGSSSGTAAAVAARCCAAGIGTDTGGSIRIPAACCGVTGLRPTRGLISLEGVFPRAYSLDTAGPLAATVADAALLLDAMVGHDEPAAQGWQTSSPDLDKGVHGLRLGVIRNHTYRGLDTDVESAIHQSVKRLADAGAEVVEVAIPALEDAPGYDKLFSTILLYEFGQIMASTRHDTPANAFGPLVRRDLDQSAAISKETYHQSLEQAGAFTLDLKKAFQTVDALITPAQPMVAPPQGAAPKVFARMRRFVQPFSLAGLPAVVVPCGWNAQGLPVGLQIAADAYQEAVALRVAAAAEWRRPFRGSAWA